MARRKALSPLVLGVGAAIALVVGVEATRRINAPPAEPAASAFSTDGLRTTYRPDRLPSLELPDGRTETIRSVLNVPGPLRYGNYVWQADDVPPGQVWVYVDLTRQLLSAFRGGHEIGSAVILYGANAKPSPTGVFPVLQKAKDYHSRTYDAPMPFMLRLTADGVAVHGSQVRNGAATHGCIGVPAVFARKLFEQVRLGDRVVIVRSPAPSA